MPAKLDEGLSNLQEHIRKELLVEPKSISAITRGLASKGIKPHRLMLTGYLKALADLGILEEKEILPSKVYSVVKWAEKSIYSDVRKLVDRRAFGDDRIRLSVLALQQIFDRPVFLEELRRMDLNVSVSTMPPDVQRIVGNDRAIAKQRAEEAQKLELPPSDPAFVYLPANSEDKTQGNAPKPALREMHLILVELLRTSYGIDIGKVSSAAIAQQAKKEPMHENDKKKGRSKPMVSLESFHNQ